MNNQDYIRKAVEFADGWDWHTDKDGGWLGGPDMGWHEDIISQGALDALAAQLVRQVESIKDFSVMVDDIYILIYMPVKAYRHMYEGDRTMNTIKAIVDSKVLE